MNNSDLENVWLGKKRMDPSIRPIPVGRAWDFLKGDGDIKTHFKDGNLNKIHALREKSRYEARAKLGIWVCSGRNPLNWVYSFDTFALRQREYH